MKSMEDMSISWIIEPKSFREGKEVSEKPAIWRSFGYQLSFDNKNSQ